MIDLLRRAAVADGARCAVVTNDREFSYDELLRSAESCAAGLRERGLERFGIVDHDAATVVTLLAAASLVGAQACVYPPLDDPAEIMELATRFDHVVLVSDRTDLSGSVFRPADLRAATMPVEPPSSRPHLVLTTGTTGAPRGVLQDWQRVAAPFRDLPATHDRWLLAYGLHQFAGLQILLHVLGSGATLVAPAPRRPREGLAAMREHAVTHASATPTYWRFLLAEMHSDGGPVPALTQITLGGEPPDAALLDNLAATFPAARVSQIYAASESGALRSVRDGEHGLPISVLEAGDDAHVQVKVVDDELWVRSRIGMLGYYGEPPLDPDAWRATGDLVEVVGDRILFTGRTSEIINVGGVKVHPLPIEERISAVPGVVATRVYGRPNRLTGAIVAVDVVAAPDADQEALDSAVRAACEDLQSAARPRSIKFVETIATIGGKTLRNEDLRSEAR